MAVDTILVLITLASAVVGTILNSKPSVKVAVIALAVAASTLTLIKAYQDNREKAFMTGALATLLGATKPTPRFHQVFTHSLAEIAKRHGYALKGSTQSDHGELFVFDKYPLGGRAGAMFVSFDDMGAAWVAYVSRQPLDHALESVMFEVPQLKTDDDLYKLLDELAQVGRFAFIGNIPWLSASTPITTSIDEHSLGVMVSGEENGHSAKTRIDEQFIRKIASLPPIQRNLSAYGEFVKQLVPRP